MAMEKKKKEGRRNVGEREKKKGMKVAEGGIA